MDTSRPARVGRQHILEVAERLFTEHGYRATSIREIAQACGVTNAALYYYFPSKEALFFEVMQRHAERLRQRMTEAGARTQTPRERLAAILREYTHIVTDQDSPFFLLRRGARGFKQRKALRTRFGRLMTTMLAPMQETLAEALAAGELRSQPDPAEAAAMLIGMLHGLVQHRRTCTDHNPPTSDEDVDLIVDVFWQGMSVTTC
ncbi:MAG: TetR/AcrR family transcriptional regulator [Anaerolineae bacterium]|nr:MAG: TetR/AcrR family transcriptional regulator [Anaerolineae bacterium]